MALSTETQNWLDDLKKAGSLTDEAYGQLKTTLEGKADEFVKGSVLRQADYSRTMAEVQKAQKAVEDSQAALADREKQVTKYQEDLGAWKQGADVNFQKAIKEREAAANKANAAIARLKSLAVANGLAEDEVLKDLDVVVVPDKKDIVSDIDTSKFVTREQIATTMAESALIDASIHDISVQYQELTGKPYKNASKDVQEAIQAKQPLGVYIAAKYKFADLEKAAQDADIQRRIDEAVKAKETEILSNVNLQGAGAGLRTDLKGSPLLAAAAGDGLKSPGDGQGGVSAAVAAFNAGKFRQGQGR